MDLVEECKAKKKEKKSKLNMSKFIEVLPDLESTKKASTAVRTKMIPTARKLSKKEALKLESEHFKKVIDHSAFKRNPVQAISAHIQQKYQQNK